LIHLAFGPDSTAVPVYDALYGSKANAGSREFVSRVQPLEGSEQLGRECAVEPRTIVAHEESSDPILLGLAKFDARRGLLAREFPGIAQEILE
jgi:hypothetical protein